MSINYKKKYLKYKNKYYNLIQLKHKNIIKGGSVGIDSFIYGTLLGSIILLLYSGYVKYVNNDNNDNNDNDNNAVYKSIKYLSDNYSIPYISEISEIKSNKIPSSKTDILKEPFIIKEDLNTELLNQYDKKEIINDYSQPNVDVTKDDKIKTEQMPESEQIDSKDLPDVKTILENIKNIVIKPPYKKSVLLVDDRYYDYKGNLNNNSYPGYFEKLQNLISEKKDMSVFNVFASSDELSKNDNHIQINIFEKDFINSDNIFDVVVYKQPDNINIEDFINNIKNILKIVSPNNGNGIFILNINILQSIDTIVDKIKNNLDNIQKYDIELINLNTEYVLKIKKKEIVENDMVQYKEKDDTFNIEQIDKVNQETPFDNPTFNLKNRTTDTVWDKITKIEQPVLSAEQPVPSAEQPEQSIEQPVTSAEQSQVLETKLNFEVNTIIKIKHNDKGEYIYGRVECNNNVQILTSKFNNLGLIKNEKYNTIPNTFTVTPTNMKIAHFPNLDNLDLREVTQEGFTICNIKKLYVIHDVIHDEKRVISVIKISTNNEIEDQITIKDYQRKGLSTLLVDTLAKDIEEKDIEEKELYYIFTEHPHVKKMWESTKIFYSLDEQKSEDFIGLNNKTYNLDKNYWVLRNNNCTTMYIFFNSGDKTFSENRENAINELGDTIPSFNITSIDFENKKKIHNDTEISLDNPNFNSDYMTNLFKNKFGEIKNAFITIMSHASDADYNKSNYKFGQDNIGFIYGTSFVEVLDNSSYDNIVIYLATCYSNLLREYITREKHPNIAIITGPLIAFGANYLSLNKSLRFIQDYNLEKSVKPFTMEMALSHMLGNQLIILDNYEGLDEQTIEEKFRDEPFISILREWNQTKKREIGLVENIAIDTMTNLLETKIKKYISEINDYEVNLQPILTFIDESHNETKDIIINDSPILTEWYTSLKIFVQEFFENPDTSGFVKGRIYVPDKLSQESANLFFCKNR